MNQIFNLEALVSVEIVEPRLTGYISYIPPKPKTFWSKAHDGYYEDIFNKQYSEESLLKDGFGGVRVLIIDNSVREYPYVKLTFAGGKTKKKVFNTYEEATAWGEDQANKNITAQLIFKS